MNDATAPNSPTSLLDRKAAGRLTWSGPALMLFARSAFAVVAQGLVALVYAARGSTAPWRDAAPWLPVYGSLIDAGCLGLLWWLTRREGIRLRDLAGFDRRRLVRDLLFGVALVVPSLALIVAGNLASSLLVFGRPEVAMFFAPLPLAAALYAVLVFPVLWGITEQATYNGYLLPRFQAMSGSTAAAVAVVAFFWSFQHCVMPLTFDPDFMLYRVLSPIPHTIFVALVYLRIRRIVPLATAHALMDGGAAFYGNLGPLLS